MDTTGSHLEFLNLFNGSFDESRVGVAVVARGDTHEEIDVFFAFGTPDPWTLSFYSGDGDGVEMGWSVFAFDGGNDLFAGEG